MADTEVGTVRVSDSGIILDGIALRIPFNKPLAILLAAGPLLRMYAKNLCFRHKWRILSQEAATEIRAQYPAFSQQDGKALGIGCLAGDIGLQWGYSKEEFAWPKGVRMERVLSLNKMQTAAGG